MRPMGAYASSGPIADGTVPKIVLPHIVGFSSHGRLDISIRNKPAGANLSRYSKRTNLGPNIPLLSHHLSSANGTTFGVASLSQPSVRRKLNGPRATVSKKSGFPISVVTLGGIIAAGVAVLLLLLLFFYIRHRRRKRRSKKVGDLENRKFLLAGHERSGPGRSSANHSNDLLRSNLNHAHPISQPLYKAAGPVSILTLPISHVSDGKNGRAHPLPRPPPLMLPPVLRPGYGARRGDSFTVARSMTARPMGSGNRGSFLPNPWDSGAKPSPAAFERAVFGLPSSAPAVRPANSFRAGLPRTTRELRTFLPPELRPPEPTRFTATVNRSGFNSGRRPAPM